MTRRCLPITAASPVLGAVDVQHVGVRVFALYWNVTGRVPSLSPHDAEAVDAGHLGRRLSTSQPGEQPAHLVRQVIWEKTHTFQSSFPGNAKAGLDFENLFIFVR